jgi:hypothetical protein
MMTLGSTVRLTVDLTRYHPNLTQGATGTLVELHHPYGDRFCVVSVPTAGRWPILYQSLEAVQE